MQSGNNSFIIFLMDTPSQKFDQKTLEVKWQKYWKDTRLDTPRISDAKKPLYNLMMFPYPSAEGLHVGNMYAFTGSDIYGRFMRMQGHDVFEPIGLDGFGIHSENYALKVGRHPKEHARLSEKHFYEQLVKIGAMFDWTRTLETYDPAYYRWTQWLFTEMFRHGLAYRGKASVNWCGSCKTVLSDEQVIQKTSDGIQTAVCERCGNKVEKKLMEQWFFRITAYAEKLLTHLPALDWSEKVKLAQEKWIGKKEGVIITYSVVTQEGKGIGSIDCFTTRPDTNFGATFVVLAPEHQYISHIYNYISQDIKKQIDEYRKSVQKMSERERIAEGRRKTGVCTGLFCVNPLNGYKMPVYISDFVLTQFGTGAVVGVPGHDTRDFEFAQTMGLEILRVVVGPDGANGPIEKKEDVYEGYGMAMHSGFLDGLQSAQALLAIEKHLETKGLGKHTNAYHLRDWIISRQRYWGAPIPMIFCESCYEAGHGEQEAMPGWWSVPNKDLPVLLPDIADYKPRDDGVGPLAKHKEFYEVSCPHCSKPARRETDVCDTFLDSAWYYLRYPSVGSATADIEPFDKEITKKWLPVSMYTGGAEHSVLHLLYSRFVALALHDWGFVPFEEPFSHFFAHGLVIKDGAKMSKSKGNVVNPDIYIEKYGADALRMYLMFMGPFADGGDFRDTGMEGMHRFIGRIWRLITLSAKHDSSHDDGHIHRLLQKAIARVTDDLSKRRYNTAIAALMEFANSVQQEDHSLSVDDAKDLVKLLAPFAPHMAEELWCQLTTGETTISENYRSVHIQQWPVFDKSLLIDSSIQFVIQVNGKVRDTLSLSPKDSLDQKRVETLAKDKASVKKYLTPGVKKSIFVPGKLLNFVV